ncbi:MAG: dihydrolipoyl dehydrogenase [Thermodesulfobacteriota bacterium]|nr:dihydrolipoyl dehydrogenase [Thermodesulfobacteriota bacterium]
MQNPFGKKNKEKTYDVIVIGSGSGMLVVENAIAAGLRTALVDKGPAGGTCLNVGCIPSKMLIAAADRVMEINEADRFGIAAEITHIDFPRIMAEMHSAVAPDHQRIHENLAADQRFDYYEGQAAFVDEYTLSVNETRIRGKAVFIAAGARPLIPALEGLDQVDYLTSESLLSLKRLPERLAIIGGGYIAAEYGHFFSAMGSEVTVIQNAERMVPREEPEISQILQAAFSLRMTVHTNAAARSLKKRDNGCEITVRDNPSGDTFTVHADAVLIAAGRASNADLLQVENTGVALDEGGFIETDGLMRTSKPGIWAFGDINGKKMFTHVSYEEAGLAWRNYQNDTTRPFDYLPTPRAVFSHPRIASVGLTEAEARERYDNILVGHANYSDVANGMALRDKDGVAKAIVDKSSYRILGFHIVGPHAAILIQEIVNVMALGGQLRMLAGTMHIHPALSELILKPFGNLS